LNLAKERKGVGDRKEEETKKLKCFRCQEYGHHQKDCSNPPIWYKCKEGHLAAECANLHAKSGELKMFEFAVPDQGFYNIMIPRGDVVKASCLIYVI
jgi:hypothetical protein